LVFEHSTSEDRIKCAVNMSTNLHVLMLHHLAQFPDYVYLRRQLLACVFAPLTE
jgi:hypothetical protein